MSRAVLVLVSDAIREKAKRWVAGLPQGTRVTFLGPRRTLPQNDRMWAMLTDIATQKEHCGRRYPPEVWKVLFLEELGKHAEYIPTLEGSDLVAIGQSSSDLSIPEMSDMIELMFAWGARNGVAFHELEEAEPTR